MGFPSLTKRTRHIDDHSISPDAVVWGVRRKYGHDGIYDPAAHNGLTKHAFYAGNDVEAVCGYRSVGRRERRAVPLAAATELNPACPQCTAAVALVEVVPLRPLMMLPEVQRPAEMHWLRRSLGTHSADPDVIVTADPAAADPAAADPAAADPAAAEEREPSPA